MKDYPGVMRYVVYARKSTEDEGRQLRSIKDQIADCLRLAERDGLNIVEIVEEKKSAKKPNRRPLFDKLLRDIASKKYDGIIAWHPDRLSRNMLESGKIIDMLDTGELKDLRFNSHQFSNDASGKMLLGMLFVFSKQYSDDLSDKVSRGVKGNFEEGKSAGAYKWGYERDEETGLYVPSEHYDVIYEAWRRRLAGEPIAKIYEYTASQGVQRQTKSSKRFIKLSKTTLFNLFHDPIYYGTLIQT